MGNEPMLERYLEKFLTEKSYAQLLEAVAAGDREAAGVAVRAALILTGNREPEEGERQPQPDNAEKAGSRNGPAAIFRGVLQRACFPPCAATG